MEKWRQDLRFAADKLPEIHADLHHTVSPEQFAAALDRLSGSLPGMAPHEVVVELARIVASIGDGHTRLALPIDPGAGFRQGHSPTASPAEANLVFRHYPIRLYLYSDGLFVRRIESGRRRWAGARVLRIGRLSAEEAIEAVSPIIHRDNPMTVKRHLPYYLVVPEVLHALRVVDDMESAPFLLRDRDGRQATVTLEPVPIGGEVDWADARDLAANPTPLYLENPDHPFDFEYLDRHRTVCFRYNRVADGESETLARFAERLFGFVEKEPVERMIIDLRHNDGGDNSLNRSLLHGLIRCGKLAEWGRLYAIVGRGTFSAAMMFALDLERHTRCLFVGEATGGAPNSYGDSRKLLLPRTGLTIRASTLYWQYSDPRDDRPWIEPHFPVGLSSDDYRENRDPALATILELAPPAAAAVSAGRERLAGRWEGTAAPAPYAPQSVSIVFNKEGPAWGAVLDLPGPTPKSMPLEGVRFDPPQVRFEYPMMEGGNLLFEGTLRGDLLLGALSRGAFDFPVILRRAKP